MAMKIAVLVLASVLFLSTKVISSSSSTAEERYDLMESSARAPSPALAPRFIVDPKTECGGACKERCKLHSRQNVCGRACNTCCSVCKCVPPGTSGNAQLCGKCYTDWKTHGDRPKCP